MSIVNHFCNKIVSAQLNAHIIQILRRVPPKGGFLFVRRKCHARLRSTFFQIKWWCRKTLHLWGTGGHIWPNRFFT